MKPLSFWAVLAVCVSLSVAQSQQVRSAAPPARAGKPKVSSSDSDFHSAAFGFTYKLPFGWVERTEQMQDDATDKSKAQVLLAVFERPPEAVGSTVNSAVIIATESVAAYPKLKTAADYFGPLTELTTGNGLKVATEPGVITVGTTRLVRGDFSREDGALSLYQASLVMLAKGHIVSFTFLGGSADEVEELVGKLSFAGAKVRSP